MVLVLILDRGYMACRGRPKRADLLRPTSSPFDQEIDDTTFGHVALHPRCPRIPPRAIYTQPEIQRVQDATQRAQRPEQVRSVGRPAPAIQTGDRDQPIPTPTACRPRPPLFATGGPHQDKMVLSHDQIVRLPALKELRSFHAHAATGVLSGWFASHLKGLIPVVPSAAKIPIAPSAAPIPSLSTSKRPANSLTCPSAHSTGMSAARSFS
jgi:hypothetical protein